MLHGSAGPQRAEDGAETGARRWAARSGGVAPADAIAASAGRFTDDAVDDFGAPSWCFAWASRWTIYLRPTLR